MQYLSCHSLCLLCQDICIAKRTKRQVQKEPQQWRGLNPAQTHSQRRRGERERERDYSELKWSMLDKVGDALHWCCQVWKHQEELAQVEHERFRPHTSDTTASLTLIVSNPHDGAFSYCGTLLCYGLSFLLFWCVLFPI